MLYTEPEKYHAFRDEVRQFLHDHLTDDLREDDRLRTSVFPDLQRSVEWQKILNKQGWAAQGWPKEYGGTGWDAIQKYIYRRESVLAGAPGLMLMGLDMCGPVLIGYGTRSMSLIGTVDFRSAHIHVKIKVDSKDVTTQVWFPDDPRNSKDVAFWKFKDTNVVSYVPDAPVLIANFDFVI